MASRLVFEKNIHKVDYITMYSVTVTNNSGSHLGVAIFVTNASPGGVMSLVWQQKIINNNGHYTFTWNPVDFGLGWGSATREYDARIQFTSGEPPKAVFPDVKGGADSVSVRYLNGSFLSDEPYYANMIAGQLKITTDRSFDIKDSAKMYLALFINKSPAIITKGKPNSRFDFNSSCLSYYLTATDLPPGLSLPDMDLNTDFIGISTPTLIHFTKGNEILNYTLDPSLSFIEKP
ncbi:MAG: hypothetical protein WAK61_00445 [Leclercia sp.]